MICSISRCSTVAVRSLYILPAFSLLTNHLSVLPGDESGEDSEDENERPAAEEDDEEESSSAPVSPVSRSFHSKITFINTTLCGLGRRAWSVP